jgi:NAD(P)-dependent dehydrogenase (short-subunit alcohol dehydrogenase family)
LSDLFDVEGASAVVTGAASGLGFAMAEVMADSGARVTMADLDAEGLEQAASRMSGDVRTFQLDVSDGDAVERLFDDVAAEHGRVDVAFANAGISLEPGVLDPQGGLEALDLAAWEKVLGVNLNGVVFTMKAAARHMKKQGGGRIVVTASTAGFGTDPMVGYSYSATKAAVIMIVRQAALELAKHGVHVNAIAPGPFRTNIGGDVAPIPPEAWNDIVAFGRMAEPDELKGVALLLASPASSFMTGAVIPVDGGQLLMSHGV